MGCEPRGFGWSATVEVCSARVTRLVTDLKNHEKFSTRQPEPGTGLGTRFASIDASTGAWHRARGRYLLAFRFEIAKVPGTWDGLDGSEAQEGGSPGQACAEAAQ
jgi:hypothetical protein